MLAATIIPSPTWKSALQIATRGTCSAELQLGDGLSILNRPSSKKRTRTVPGSGQFFEIGQILGSASGPLVTLEILQIDELDPHSVKLIFYPVAERAGKLNSRGQPPKKLFEVWW